MQTNQEDREFDVIGFGTNALDLIGVVDGHPEPDTKAPLLDFDVQGGGVAATLAGEGVIGLEDGRWVRVPGLRVGTVDTNGAGDVFHGACAIGELRGWPLEWVLTFANAVAAMKCRHLGGRRGIPRLPEVIEFLAAHGRPDIVQALT